MTDSGTTRLLRRILRHALLCMLMIACGGDVLSQEINALFSAADAARRNGKFEEMVGFLEQIIALPTFPAEPYGRKKRVYGMLVKGFTDLGDREKMGAALATALSAAEAENDSEQMQSCHGNLGIAARGIGHYAEAEQHLKIAEQLADARKDWKALRQILENLLANARELGMQDEVALYETRLAELARYGGVREAGSVEALADRARSVEAEEGRQQQAIDLFRQALAKSPGRGRKRVDLLLDLADCQRRAGQPQEALASLTAAIQECEASALRREAASCILARGVALYDLGLLDSSEADLAHAIRGLENTEAIATAFYNLGLVAKSRGDIQHATDAFVRSVLMYEKTRSQVSGTMDSERVRKYLASRIEAYENCIGSLSERSLFESAFKVMELAQARTLFESLQNLGGDQKQNGITLSSDSIINVQDPLALIDEVYHQVGAIALADVKAAVLDHESALLEYFIGKNRAFVFVATGAGQKIVELMGPSVLSDAVEKFRTELTRRTGTADFLQPKDTALSSMLLADVWPMIEKRSHLFVVPSGALWVVPFETLTEPAIQGAGQRPPLGAGSGRPASFRDLPFLVRHYAITYSQSASILFETQKRVQPPTYMLVAFADPSLSYVHFKRTNDVRRDSISAQLLYARQEVQDIARHFAPESTRLFIGADATERAAKRMLDTAQHYVLHFATHGYLSRDGGQRVGLILNKTPGEDGILESSEIMRMRLHADIVVLSACETGLGMQMAGEGTMGLARAFALAGSRAVVVSLWAVADRTTAQLMSTFYQELRRSNGDVPRALQRAQLSLLESEKTSAPFYWAPFIGIGL
jgi:CHAT domain-containing protein